MVDRIVPVQVDLVSEAGPTVQPRLQDCDMVAAAEPGFAVGLEVAVGAEAEVATAAEAVPGVDEVEGEVEMEAAAEAEIVDADMLVAGDKEIVQAVGQIHRMAEDLQLRIPVQQHTRVQLAAGVGTNPRGSQVEQRNHTVIVVEEAADHIQVS